jgi:hypothetical protein
MNPEKTYPLYLASEEQYPINPKTGRRRLLNGDVEWAIDMLGGIQSASTKLAVTEDEIEKWIDEHYIPDAFADDVAKTVGTTTWFLQEPPGYLVDEERNIIWPPHPPKVCVFRGE